MSPSLLINFTFKIYLYPVTFHDPHCYQPPPVPGPYHLLPDGDSIPWQLPLALHPAGLQSILCAEARMNLLNQSDGVLYRPKSFSKLFMSLCVKSHHFKDYFQHLLPDLDSYHLPPQSLPLTILTWWLWTAPRIYSPRTSVLNFSHTWFALLYFSGLC